MSKPRKSSNAISNVSTGWKTKRLCELAELAGRIGWRGLTAKEYTETGPLFLSVHSLNYGDFVDFRDAFHITQTRYDESPEIMLQSGDILICKDGAGIGKLGIIADLPSQATINSSLLMIRPGQSILPKYLYHCLSSPYFQQIVLSRLNGATTPHLYQRDINDFPVHLPSLDEQERITAVLDEAFEGIGTAKAIIERSRANARRLFESKLQSLIGSPTENWPRTNLGEQTDISTGFPFKSQGYTASDDSMKLLRGDNIIQGQLRWEDVKKWPIADTEEYKDYELQEGDVVLAMDRTWVKAGIKYAVLSSEDLPCLLVQRTARLRARKTLHPKFLRWLIGIERFTQYVLSVQTGSGVPHISGPQIKAFKFQLPSMKDQLLISSILDDLLAETNRLDGVYSQKLSALDELKQSFLQSAFSKEL